MRSINVRLIWRVARIFLIAYGLLLILMLLFENSLLYHTSKFPEGDWEPKELAFEDAWFKAADGTQLHGWFVPCESPRAVALFAHGNAGNVTDRVDFLHEMHRLGVAVLAFDYRGYGRSSGTPNEAGILADGRAAQMVGRSHRNSRKRNRADGRIPRRRRGACNWLPRLRPEVWF